MQGKHNNERFLEVLKVLVYHWALGEPCTADHIKHEVGFKPDAYVKRMERLGYTKGMNGIVAKIPHDHDFVELVLISPYMGVTDDKDNIAA